MGVNRAACARYKQELDALLPAEWSAAVYTEHADDARERPLVARYQLPPAREPEVLLNFKRAGRDPRILIVHRQAADRIRRAAAVLPGRAAALAVAREAAALLRRFPNAAVNLEEQRRLRAALYKPLLGLHRDERAQVVEHVLALLLQPADDDG